MAVRLLVKQEEKTTLWISEDELSIIKSIAEGKTSREIAAERGLSNRAIEGRRFTVLKRFGCKNTAQLVMILAREKRLE